MLDKLYSFNVIKSRNDSESAGSVDFAGGDGGGGVEFGVVGFCCSIRF